MLMLGLEIIKGNIRLVEIEKFVDCSKNIMIIYYFVKLYFFFWFFLVLVFYFLKFV